MTKSAIEKFQKFVNMYPKSKWVADANENIDKLRFKLQKKDFEIAKLYYKIEEYKSAVIAFNNLVKEYPDTPFKEESLYYIAISYYEYANKSIANKKYERYNFAIEAASNFAKLFPDSKYTKNIDQIYKTASKEITKYKKPNS